MGVGSAVQAEETLCVCVRPEEPCALTQGGYPDGEAVGSGGIAPLRVPGCHDEICLPKDGSGCSGNCE